MENRLKILFEYEDFEGMYSLESMWAIKSENGFKIDNIPFYVKGYALGDVVSVVDKEGEFYADELIEESGHSTVRILFNNENDVSQTRNDLQTMQCESEISDIAILIAVDIPPTIKYSLVKAYLDQGESLGKWGYQEACIAQ